MTGSRVWLVFTIASICVAMAASEGWAASKGGGGRNAAIMKCIADVQARFGGPANSPDGDQQARLAQYTSCMKSAGYRP